jgi:hypothetical protein
LLSISKVGHLYHFLLLNSSLGKRIIYIEVGLPRFDHPLGSGLGSEPSRLGSGQTHDTSNGANPCQQGKLTSSTKHKRFHGFGLINAEV